MELKIIRTDFTKDATAGYLTIDSGLRFCYTLEDARRFPGIKIPKDTCIPTGRYRIRLSHSRRFNRTMPMIYNCSNGYELKGEGISFKGIRMHGGNTSNHTEGCPLVAFNRINDTTIQGTAEKTLTAHIDRAIKRGEGVWLEVIDKI